MVKSLCDLEGRGAKGSATSDKEPRGYATSDCTSCAVHPIASVATVKQLLPGFLHAAQLGALLSLTAKTGLATDKHLVLRVFFTISLQSQCSTRYGGEPCLLAWGPIVENF